jgi:TRAP-type mannitol/chloroaromatic compound transport system substrate-binding protein
VKRHSLVALAAVCSATLALPGVAWAQEKTRLNGEATQFRAIRDVQEKHGVQVRRWSPEIMTALDKAWKEAIAEESTKNANFKRVWVSYTKFRADYAIWREYGDLN